MARVLRTSLVVVHDCPSSPNDFSESPIDLRIKHMRTSSDSHERALVAEAVDISDPVSGYLMHATTASDIQMHVG